MLKRCLFVTLFGLLSMIVPASAWAQDCDSIVVDGAGVFADRLSDVETAARRVASDGADVRVRTVPGLGGFANLDQLEASMRRSCPSWQSPDGTRKSNLILLMLSFDRALNQKKAGLYYGGTWTPRLRDTWPGILSQQLAPRVRSGDFVLGVTSALDAIDRAIAPAAAPAPVPVQPQPAPAPTIVVNTPAPQPSGPADHTGLWVFAAFAGAILLVVGLVFFFRSRAKRRAAQQKAQAVRSSCSNRITELDDPLSLVGARLAKAAKAVSDEDAAPLKAQLESIKGLANRTTAQYGDLQSSQNNPDRNGLSAEEYAAMESAYQAVLNSLDEVRTQREALEKAVTGLQAKIDQAQPAIDALKKDNEDAAGAIASAQEQGYKTEAIETTFADAVTAVENAESALANKRFGAVASLCAAGKRKAAEAKAAAEDLPRRKAAIGDAISALKVRIENVKASIDAAKPVFQYIEANYAASSWESVRGNGGQAELRVKNAGVSAVNAASAASMNPEDESMNRQDWAAAERAVAEGKASLDEAESLIRSIHTAKAGLDKAKADAKAEIDAAQADIDRAAEYERTHDADIDDAVKADIKAAKTTLQGARDELAKAKPDYFKVVGDARKANAAADKILDRCRSEHEAAERLRQKAASAVRDAVSRVAKAEEYIDDHRSDVGRTAKGYLADAKDLLKQAEGTRDLSTRTSLAESAETKAKKALSQAKSDVSDAEEARRPKYTAPSYSSPSSSGSDAFVGGLIGGAIGGALGGGSSRSSSSDSGWSGGWGGGGGGSIDIGGGDSGGGGSIDIGGGDSGGGGSMDI